jgi:hypothetical protein
LFFVVAPYLKVAKKHSTRKKERKKGRRNLRRRKEDRTLKVMMIQYLQIGLQNEITKE